MAIVSSLGMMALSRIFRIVCVSLALSVTLSACSVKVGPQEIVSPDYPEKVMPTAEEERQCNALYSKTSSNKRVSWKGAIPVTFYFDPSFPADFVPAVQAAMDTWNQAAGFKIFQDKGYRKTATLPGNDGLNIIYFASAKSPALAGAAKSLFNEDGTIAVTHEYSMANKLVDTDIIFDGVDKDFSDSRFHFGSYDVESTALHELGHALGLDHSPDPFSIMFFGGTAYSFALRKIDSTSRELISCEYN